LAIEEASSLLLLRAHPLLHSQGDPHDLGMRAFANDELRQDSSTGETICNY
jgi:hypothetical protein